MVYISKKTCRFQRIQRSAEIPYNYRKRDQRKRDVDRTSTNTDRVKAIIPVDIYRFKKKKRHLSSTLLRYSDTVPGRKCTRITIY